MKPFYLSILIITMLMFSGCASLKNIFFPEQPEDVGKRFSLESLAKAEKDKPHLTLFKPCLVDGKNEENEKVTAYFTLAKHSQEVIEFREITPTIEVLKTMPKDRADDPNIAKLVIKLGSRDAFTIFRSLQINGGGSWSRFEHNVFSSTDDPEYKGYLPDTIEVEFINNQWKFKNSFYEELPKEITCKDLVEPKTPSLAKFFPSSNEVYNNTNANLANTNNSNANSGDSNTSNSEGDTELTQIDEDVRLASENNLKNNAEEIAVNYIRSIFIACNGNNYARHSGMYTKYLSGDYVLFELPKSSYKVLGKEAFGNGAVIEIALKNLTAHVWNPRERYEDSYSLDDQSIILDLRRVGTNWNVYKSSVQWSKPSSCDEVRQRRKPAE